MASIRPRKDRDGIVIGYQVQVQRKGYPSQTKTFRSKADAQAWSIIIEAEMERGVWRDRAESESTALTEALARYADEIVPTKKSPRQEMSVIHYWQDRPIAQMFLAAIRGRTFHDLRHEATSRLFEKGLNPPCRWRPSPAIRVCRCSSGTRTSRQRTW